MKKRFVLGCFVTIGAGDTANRLSMAMMHSEETLCRSGHSNRKIAQLLGIDRGTVNSYVRRSQAAAGDDAAGPAAEDPQTDPDQNRPNPHTGVRIAGTGSRDGTITRQGFERLMPPIRQEIDGLLLSGVYSGNGKLRGMCGPLYAHRDRLWTFVDIEGVEPTNNASAQPSTCCRFRSVATHD